MCQSISKISIHAPTRGATTTANTRCRELVNFNPRSHERSDQAKSSKDCVRPYFNPRSHERSDVIHRHCRCNAVYFNPRPHERSDKICCIKPTLVKISIHAPTRGATSFTTALSMYLTISIHAPTRGATS